MNMFKAICGDCGQEFKNMRSGVLVKELFMQNTAVYRIWSADRLACPECGKVIIARFADNPIAEHWNEPMMDAALRECETRKLGFDLFEWKEFVSKEKK